MSWHVHQGLEFTKESKDKTGDGLKPAKESQDKTVDGAADDSAGEFERRAEAVYLQVLSACMCVCDAIDGSACPFMEHRSFIPKMSVCVAYAH
jgi:hypothetical protein